MLLTCRVTCRIFLPFSFFVNYQHFRFAIFYLTVPLYMIYNSSLNMVCHLFEGLEFFLKKVFLYNESLLRQRYIQYEAFEGTPNISVISHYCITNISNQKYMVDYFYHIYNPVHNTDLVLKSSLLSLI